MAKTLSSSEKTPTEGRTTKPKSSRGNLSASDIFKEGHRTAKTALAVLESDPLLAAAVLYRAHLMILTAEMMALKTQPTRTETRNLDGLVMHIAHNSYARAQVANTLQTLDASPEKATRIVSIAELYWTTHKLLNQLDPPPIFGRPQGFGYSQRCEVQLRARDRSAEISDHVTKTAAMLLELKEPAVKTPEKPTASPRQTR